MVRQFLSESKAGNGRRQGMKKGKRFLSHRTTAYPCCLPALGVLRELVARDLPHRKDRAQPVRTLRFMNKISVAAPHGVYAALGSFVLTLAVYLIKANGLQNSGSA